MPLYVCSHLEDVHFTFREVTPVALLEALDRVYFAGLTKKGLKKSDWRYLTEGEVNILKMGAYV